MSYWRNWGMMKSIITLSLFIKFGNLPKTVLLFNEKRTSNRNSWIIFFGLFGVAELTKWLSHSVTFIYLFSSFAVHLFFTEALHISFPNQITSISGSKWEKPRGFGLVFFVMFYQHPMPVAIIIVFLNRKVFKKSNCCQRSEVVAGCLPSTQVHKYFSK